MALRPEERHAGEVFERWLVEQGMPGSSIAWEPVESDPPDLCFTVEKKGGSQELWAVEVTTLVQYVEFNGEERNVKDFFALLTRLCELLNQAIPEIAARGYLIFGSGPFDAKLVKTVEERAIRYMKSGGTELEYLDFEEAKIEALRHLNSDPNDPGIQSLAEEVAISNSRFSIQAMPTLNKVEWTGWLHASAKTPDGKNFAGEIRATLDYALQRILKAKLPALKKLTGYQRRMLLILSDYFYAEPERMREILQEKGLPPESVDTVFLIDGAVRVSVISDPARLFQAGS